MELGSRWGKDGFCDGDRHQTDMSGDVMGNGRCSGRDGVVLSWPAYVFNHQLFLPTEDSEERSPQACISQGSREREWVTT